jgi:sensor histidine kinase regulating citrate/malate metabolism
MTVKVKLDKPQVRAQLLKSAAVRAEVERVAKEVAARAGAEFIVQMDERPLRVVANVFDPEPGAFRREASSGTLARAVGK